MKNKFNLSTTIILIFFAIILVINSFAQKPKTVKGFYLRMPADKYSTKAEGKAVKGKRALKKFRKSLIKIKDIPNGYLQLEELGKIWSEIAIFKKNDGSYIVGQSCKFCDREVEFFSYQKGVWTNIIKDILPDPTQEQLIESLVKKNLSLEGNDVSFMMPRKGHTLRMVCGECKSSDGKTPFVYDGGDTFKSEIDGKMKYVIISWDWNGEMFVLNQQGNKNNEKHN